MELIQGSETSANYNLTPGKYPEENIKYSNHGESLKSRIILEVSSWKKIGKIGVTRSLRACELLALTAPLKFHTSMKLQHSAPLPA